MELTVTDLMAISNALRKQIGEQEMELLVRENPVQLDSIRESMTGLKELRDRIEAGIGELCGA